MDCSRFSDSCLTVSFCMFHLQCQDDNHAGFSNEANEDGHYFQGLNTGAASMSCKRTPKNRKTLNHLFHQWFKMEKELFADDPASFST